MPHDLQGWLFLSQVIMQRIALTIIVAFAAITLGWWGAAVLGWAPWLELELGSDWAAPVEAGPAVHSVLALLLVGLCFFLPTNRRVMALERSHRDFKVSMWDVARAYEAVHAADRHDTFELRSEFDSVRDRLNYLRRHPDLRDLEPEILEIAAQMSHESRELAEIYSVERIERARGFLSQRQEEAQLLQERIQTAHSICHELRRWRDKVEVEEAIARSQMKRLEDDLEELLPTIGLGLTRERGSGSKARPARIAAE